MIAAGKTPEKSRLELQKCLEILIVSVVLSLQSVPAMPQQGRAKIVCNAGIKSCNPLCTLDVSLPENQVETFDGQQDFCILVFVGNDCEVRPLAFCVVCSI